MVIVSESWPCFTSSRKLTKRNKDPWQALTYSQLLSEDGAFTQRRAVSSGRIWTGTGIRWCPAVPPLRSRWWRPAGSGRWRAGGVRDRGSYCRWCSHQGPPQRKEPCGTEETNTTSKDGHYLHHSKRLNTHQNLAVKCVKCFLSHLYFNELPKNYQKWDLYSILWALLKMGEHFYLSIKTRTFPNVFYCLTNVIHPQ